MSISKEIQALIWSNAYNSWQTTVPKTIFGGIQSPDKYANIVLNSTLNKFKDA